MHRKDQELPEEMQDEETMQGIYVSGRTQILAAVLALESDRWDPQKIIAFKQELDNFELVIKASKIEYKILSLLDIGNLYLHPTLKTYPIKDQFAYEHAKDCFLEARKIFTANSSRLAMEKKLLEECVEIGLVWHEFIANYMKIFKNILRKEVVSKGRKYKKYDSHPNIIAMSELVDEENDETAAFKATEKLFLTDKTVANDLAIKLCQLWMKISEREYFQEMLKFDTNTVTQWSWLNQNLYSNTLMVYRNILSNMAAFLKMITTQHYSNEVLDQLCNNFESPETKHMLDIFSKYKTILAEGIVEIRTNREVDLYHMASKNQLDVLDMLEDEYNRIKKTNKRISAALAISLEKAQKRKEETKAFFASLSKREEIKRTHFLKTKIPTVSTKEIQEIKEKTDKEISQITPKQETSAEAIYKLYITGKYIDAIKLCKTLLPEKIQEANSLEHYKVIFSMAECYKAWSELTILDGRHGNAKHYRQMRKLSYRYKQLAKEHYELAYKGFHSGFIIQEARTEQFNEWKMWRDLAATTVTIEVDESRYFDKTAIEPVALQVTPNTTKNIEVKPSIPKKPTVPPIKQQKFNMPLSKWVEDVANIFINKGTKLYIAGGAVRDSILERVRMNDNDFVIEKTLNKARRLLGAGEIIGKTRPILKMKNDEEQIEITPLSARPDGRVQRPVTLDDGTITVYTPANSILEDAELRDFTFNALYYDIKTKTVLDPTGKGLDDLKSGVIRTVIDPDLSLQEDPVRMLRAIRFSTKLNFKIDEASLTAINKHAALLQKVHPQRLLLEIRKCISDGNINANIMNLHKYGLLNYIFPSAYQSMQQTKPSIECIFIEEMLRAASHPYAPQSFTGLPFFLAVMLWAPIQVQIEQCKYLDKSEVYPILIKTIKTTLADNATHLGIMPELQDKIRLIWRNYISKAYDQPDIYLVENKYSVDDLMMMDNFIAMLNQSNLQYLNKYTQVSSTQMWVPKQTAKLNEGVSLDETVSSANYRNKMN